MSRTRVLSTVLALVSVKLAMLPLTSFPFDFASYVYQVRQFFDFDIHPLFYWNKGVFLLGVFYLQYALYIGILELVGWAKEHTLLLHTVYKLPLVCADLCMGIYLGKILMHHTRTGRVKDVVLLLWMATPLVTWMVEVQGQYSILASLFVVVSIYLLHTQRLVASLVTLATAASIYYYPIIFFPFFLLWHYHAARPSTYTLIKSAVVFCGTLLLLFSPFLLHGALLTDFLASLLHHAAPDAPAFVTAVGLPDYSLFKILYYLSYGEFPTTRSSSFFQVDITGMFRMTSSARYFKDGVGSSRPNWR